MMEVNGTPINENPVAISSELLMNRNHATSIMVKYNVVSAEIPRPNFWYLHKETRPFCWVCQNTLQLSLQSHLHLQRICKSTVNEKGFPISLLETLYRISENLASLLGTYRCRVKSSSDICIVEENRGNAIILSNSMCEHEFQALITLQWAWGKRVGTIYESAEKPQQQTLWR